MATLLRVCRNILQRFFPHLMWLVLVCVVAKLWMLDPWNAKLEHLNLEIMQLQDKLAASEHNVETVCQKNIQQAIETALEKERTNTQHMIESSVSTSLAQKISTLPTETPAHTIPPLNATSFDWEKAWPIIEQHFHNSEPWADVLSQSNAPDDLKRSTPAPKPIQMMANCKDAANVLDSTPAESSSSWISSMIRVRRLDTIHQHSTAIMELLQKNAWQEALIQLKEHPHHADPKVMILIKQLQDRISYEQEFEQLSTWRQQQCATSVPS